MFLVYRAVSNLGICHRESTSAAEAGAPVGVHVHVLLRVGGSGRSGAM